MLELAIALLRKGGGDIDLSNDGIDGLSRDPCSIEGLSSLSMGCVTSFLTGVANLTLSFCIDGEKLLGLSGELLDAGGFGVDKR